MSRSNLAAWARRAVLGAVALAICWACPARAADVASGYREAVGRFDKLRKDPASAGRRDLWKGLDARFAALARAAGQNPLGAKILYYQAWTNAELAERSHLDADWEAAAGLFGRMAESSPGDAWADDALLRRAVILADRLKRPAEARADLERLLRQYPKGDMAGRAGTVLAGLDGDARAAGGRGGRDEAGKASRSEVPSPATSARPATLRGAEVDRNAKGGRLTLTLDRETSYRYQLLEQKRPNGDPVKRLYIDLDNTRTGPGLSSEKRYRKGAVSRLRAGYFTPETVRVVLELENVRQYAIRSDKAPFRVILDLETGADADAGGGEGGGKPSGRETAAAPGRADRDGRAASQDGAASAKNVSQGREARGVASPPPPEPTPRMNFKPPADTRKRAGSLVEQLGLSVRTVMIDPGHGGKDPGARGVDGVTEKDVNLKFARALGEILRKKGFQVLYTRSSDVFVPLETRTEMANAKGADLFISVHCNAHGDAGSSGLETYSLNLASSQDAVRVAARENAASQKKISDLQAILTDLMLSAKTAESKDLARFVQKRAMGEVRGRYATRDRGPHEAPFFVLIGANMPAVLVELGYLSNADEAGRLSSDAYLAALARGMADGVLAYKKRIERYANL